MTTKRPPKKAPAKAGARSIPEEKRRSAAERKATLAEFHAQYGEGHNALENFIYDYDTLGDWEYAEKHELEHFFGHVEKIADAINRYLGHECRTLDEAFRVRRPDGYRQKAARKRYLHMYNLQWEACHLRKRSAVVDSAFFEYLAKRHKVDKTTASEWYYLKYRGLKPDPSLDNSDVPESVRAQLNWKS